MLDALGAADVEMLEVAADLGYSETAFLLPRDDGAFDVRYFSPLAEVPFCGHATIAAGVAYADRNGPGDLLLHTRSGPVAVRTSRAGAWHPVLAARAEDRLSDLDYDFPALGTMMAARDWTTVNLVHRREPTVFTCRNPFPPGGVYEDPATGAAAAALGGYLRELGVVPLPATLTIHQGQAMGRPSLLTVDIPSDLAAGIAVTGAAVQL